MRIRCGLEINIQKSPDMSFLEMIDVVNEQLIQDGKDPIAFDHDCREGNKRVAGNQAAQTKPSGANKQ